MGTGDAFAPTMSAHRAPREAIEPCPYRICGRFASTQVKCGSPVGLEADGTNIINGSTTTFTLTNLDSGASIGTESAPLRSDRVRGLNWVSKKPGDTWPAEEVGFRVAAAGASNISENQLGFHRYGNYAREVRSARISASGTAGGVVTNYTWDKKYEIEFVNGMIGITIKIKLRDMQGPRPAAGGTEPASQAVPDSLKQSMAQEIQGYLSGKWLFHRQNCQRTNSCDCPNTRRCCKFRVQLRVHFVESGQHHIVRLWPGTGRSSSNNWYRGKTWDNTYAHETGHLLGFYDEYAEGALGPAPWHVQNGVLMNSGATVPNYYYKDFKDWFAAKANEPWEYLAP